MMVINNKNESAQRDNSQNNQTLEPLQISKYKLDQKFEESPPKKIKKLNPTGLISASVNTSYQA